MPYRIYSRLPSGAARNYIETNTGSIISARQYRNITEANKRGFETISQYQRATKANTYTSPKLKLTVKYHTLGIPKDLLSAVATIAPRYDNKHGMALIVSYTSYYMSDGPTTVQYRQFQTSIVRNQPSSYKPMIDELKDLQESYTIIAIKNIALAMYPNRA